MYDYNVTLPPIFKMICLKKKLYLSKYSTWLEMCIFNLLLNVAVW